MILELPLWETLEVKLLIRHILLYIADLELWFFLSCACLL